MEPAQPMSAEKLKPSLAGGERVAERLRQTPVDYTTLAEFLGALSYPVRLELLDALRFPHTLSEIKLPARQRSSGEPGRPAARQTVQQHLDRLVEARLVRAEPIQREGRTMPTYVVNPPKLYELLEELRRLSTTYAGRGFAADATGTLGSAPQAEEVKGPRLVLVHGVYEGKAFPLDAASRKDGKWLIGRKRDLAVPLDYDPFISLENSAVREEAGRFFVEDLGSKNGTSVNWTVLPKGVSRQLRPGYVLGVGRSLLGFVVD
jgi:hypothetical protein